MAKRFIDISILPKGWRKVKPTLKLAFYHFWNTCDKAGVVDIDAELFEFEVGQKFPERSELKELEDLGVLEYNDEIILLCDFSSVDNGKLGTSNAHKPALRSIEKYGLFYDADTLRVTLKNKKTNIHGTLNKPSFKVQEEEGEREEEREEEIKGGVGEKTDEPEFPFDLYSDLMAYFGFSEMRNPDKQSQIYQFLTILAKDNQIMILEEQFSAYREYKEKSKEARYSFPRYIGSIDQRYRDGGWNSRNWVHELKNLSLPGHGKSIQDYNQSIADSLKMKVS
jgi:hypothetical protein